MEGNEIERKSRLFDYAIAYETRCQQVKHLTAELTRTNAQLDEMVTKYNELSKKYADLRKKHYSQ